VEAVSCCLPGFGIDDASDGTAFDELLLSAGGIAKGRGDEPVKLAQGAWSTAKASAVTSSRSGHHGMLDRCVAAG